MKDLDTLQIESRTYYKYWGHKASEVSKAAPRKVFVAFVLLSGAGLSLPLVIDGALWLGFVFWILSLGVWGYTVDPILSLREQYSEGRHFRSLWLDMKTKTELLKLDLKALNDHMEWLEKYQFRDLFREEMDQDLLRRCKQEALEELGKA